jgi:hypothetical protein
MAYFGTAPAAADTTFQSGGMMGNNSQSANRSGQTNPSGGAGASSALTYRKGKTKEQGFWKVFKAVQT